MLAGACAQDKDFKTAMAYGENALKVQKNPKERWLGFMLSVYFELGKKWDVIATLKRLVTAYPRRFIGCSSLGCISNSTVKGKHWLSTI